jgi:DNA-binding NarL/FixJ family response regulator
VTIRVLIADDQQLVRTGFGLIIKPQEDIELVGEAADGHEAIKLAAKLRPDVILMDIRMPRLDGLEATRRVLADPALQHTRILILTTFDLDEYIYDALRAGASGFLLKDAPSEQLIEGIRVVAAGDALLAPSITRRVIEAYVRQPAPHLPDRPELDELTPREREVLELIARGSANADIARRLYVSDATVKTHVAHVFSKLNLHDRAQAVVYAYETGLVQPHAAARTGERETTNPHLRPAKLP